jgi:hypothetical protein
VKFGSPDMDVCDFIEWSHRVFLRRGSAYYEKRFINEPSAPVPLTPEEIAHEEITEEETKAIVADIRERARLRISPGSSVAEQGFCKPQRGGSTPSPGSNSDLVALIVDRLFGGA